MIRARRLQTWAPPACAAAALVSAAMSLTACIGDNRRAGPAAAPAPLHRATTGSLTPAPVATLAPVRARLQDTVPRPDQAAR